MDDMLLETRLTLAQLAQQEDVHVSTVWRWAKRGVRGVRLATFHRGGRRFTTQEAFRRWVAEVATSGTTRMPSLPDASNSRVRQAESWLEEEDA